MNITPNIRRIAATPRAPRAPRERPVPLFVKSATRTTAMMQVKSRTAAHRSIAPVLPSVQRVIPILTAPYVGLREQT